MPHRLFKYLKYRHNRPGAKSENQRRKLHQMVWYLLNKRFESTAANERPDQKFRPTGLPEAETAVDAVFSRLRLLPERRP